MIKEALLALNERSGSSPYAIAKYMEEKHKDVLPLNCKKILDLQLKNSAVWGKLIKIKASYKLSEMAKEEKVTTIITKAVKKPDVAKKATKKVTKKVGHMYLWPHVFITTFTTRYISKLGNCINEWNWCNCIEQNSSPHTAGSSYSVQKSSSYPVQRNQCRGKK